MTRRRPCRVFICIQHTTWPYIPRIAALQQLGHMTQLLDSKQQRFRRMHGRVINIWSNVVRSRVLSTDSSTYSTYIPTYFSCGFIHSLESHKAAACDWAADSMYVEYAHFRYDTPDTASATHSPCFSANTSHELAKRLKSQQFDLSVKSSGGYLGLRKRGS